MATIEETENYNYMHTSAGKNDECWTERYGVEPLLPYLENYKDKIIWCPFDTEESEFVKVFREKGYNVVCSHIWNGQDYYSYEPEKWDLMISNPPFTNKYGIFERALSFGKPFALLMTLAWLNDSAPAKLFKDKDLQLLIFQKRMQFKSKQQQSKITFSSAYYCYNFLPKQIIVSDLDVPRKKRKEKLKNERTKTNSTRE